MESDANALYISFSKEFCINQLNSEFGFILLTDIKVVREQLERGYE